MPRPSYRHAVARSALALLGVACCWAAVLATATPAHAAALTYTALGDSYASGVGTRSYYSDGTSCQRSPYAYPVLDAARLGVPLTFAACAGANVAGVQNNQLGSLSAATGYVTVTVGGNDIGFTSVINQCARPWPYTCWGNIDAADNYIRGTLPGTLDTLYSRIRALAPNARVAVVGYPRLFNGETCNLLSRISSSEQSALNATADLLDSTIAARAAAHGFGYVRAIDAFVHHAICDDVEWINGLSDPTSESYHPNRSGQAGYANLVQPALAGG
jgi:lysophospholipase L1-like esterase